MEKNETNHPIISPRLIGGGLSAYCRCLAALVLLLFGNWSLNSHLFPLYDEYGSFVWEACTLVNGVVLVALAEISVRHPRLLEPRLLVLLAGSGAVAGVSLVALADMAHASFLLVVGACVLSAARGLCAVMVGLSVCRLSGVGTFVLLVAAEALSTLLCLVVPSGHSFAWLILHMVILFAVLAMTRDDSHEVLNRLKSSASPRDMALTQPASYLPFGHQFFICLLLFRLVYGFLLTFGETAGIPAVSPWGILPMVALVMVGMVFRRPVSADGLFRLAFMLSLAGILVVPAFSLVGFTVSNGLLSCGIAVFEVFNWIVLASLARKNMHAAVSVFAWGFAMNSIGVIAGANTGRMVNLYLKHDPQVVVVVIAFVVWLLVFYVVAVMRGFSFDDTISDVREAEEAVQASDVGAHGEDIDRRCDALADAYGLTPREREVLGLLARGRTGVFIQGELVISYNTVKAHIKHIYQKMGVHTHQELIDLVELEHKATTESRGF